MYALFGVLALVAVGLFLYGLFELVFRKGKRLRGLGIAVGAFVLFGVAGAFLGESVKREEGSAIAQAETPEGSDDTAIASSVDGEPDIENADGDDLPDEVMAVGAPEPDPEMVEYATLLARPEALEAYCEGMALYDTLFDRADEEFGIEPSPAKTEWVQQTDAAETAAMSEAIGVPSNVWSAHALEDHWDQRCQALDQGWPAIVLDEVFAATSTDRIEVRDALEGWFLQEISAAQLVDAMGNAYTRVRCRDAEVEGLQLAACQLEGRLKTPYYMVLVANRNGTLFAAPYDHELVDWFEGTRQITGTGDRNVLLGWFVDYPLPVPYSDLRAEFD